MADPVRALRTHLVPLLFAAVCLTGMALSGRSLRFFQDDVLERTARNAFIVLSLVIPIQAGLGLNFGIVIGAMAGEVGVIFVENAGARGAPALAAAAAISLPVAIGAGAAVGRTLNAARGREMVAGLILGYFANGIYQLVFLILAGPVLPLRNPALLLDGGVGLRGTVQLAGTGGAIPREVVFATIIALAAALVWLQKTKLGQDFRAVGQDQHVSGALGIDVDRKRIVAMVLSTILGGLGMILYLVDVRTLNTFTSHEQVGFYAIAALLVGGASVERATVAQALLGTVLFHTLSAVLPQVTQRRLGSPQLGEFLRELITYAIIGTTLAIHAWRKAREHKERQE